MKTICDQITLMTHEKKIRLTYFVTIHFFRDKICTGCNRIVVKNDTFSHKSGKGFVPYEAKSYYDK